jgi:hypothetical protein
MGEAQMSKLPDELREWSEGDAYLAPRKTKRMLDEAADRIEQLEAALNKWLHYDCGPYDSGTDMMRDYLDALDATRAAMEGKDAER